MSNCRRLDDSNQSRGRKRPVSRSAVRREKPLIVLQIDIVIEIELWQAFGRRRDNGGVLDRPAEASLKASVIEQIEVAVTIGVTQPSQTRPDRWDPDLRRNTRFEQPERDRGIVRADVGVEAEVIERAPVQGVGAGVDAVGGSGPGDLADVDRRGPVRPVPPLAVVVVRVVEADALDRNGNPLRQRYGE
jgi:hypothetical protein